MGTRAVRQAALSLTCSNAGSESSEMGAPPTLEDRNMAGEMATWGPQRPTADECSLTFRAGCTADPNLQPIYI